MWKRKTLSLLKKMYYMSWMLCQLSHIQGWIKDFEFIWGCIHIKCDQFCKNVLVYLKKKYQEKIFPHFWRFLSKFKENHRIFSWFFILGDANVSSATYTPLIQHFDIIEIYSITSSLLTIVWESAFTHISILCVCSFIMIFFLNQPQQIWSTIIHAIMIHNISVIISVDYNIFFNIFKSARASCAL